MTGDVETPQVTEVSLASPSPRPWLRGIVSAIAVLPASMLTACLFLYVENAAQRQQMLDAGMSSEIADQMSIGYPTGDLPGFAFWTIGLSVVVLFLTAFLTRVTYSRSPIVKSVGWLIAGPGAGFAWTIFVGLSLGPWMRAFSFPVLYCWIGGASIAVVAGMVVRPASTDG